jgi:hypothetical protein
LATSTAPAALSRSTTVCVVIEYLPFVGLGAPRRPDAPGGEEILDAIRDAVEWTVATPGLDVGVGLRRLLQYQRRGQRNDAAQT